MAYKLPIAQGLLGATAGVGSGLIRSFDSDEWEKNPANTNKTPVPPLDFGTDRNLWLGLALLGLGVSGHVLEFPHSDVTEGLIMPGALILAQEVTVGFAQKDNAGYAVHAAIAAAEAVRVSAPSSRPGVPARAAAYLESSAPGVL